MVVACWSAKGGSGTTVTASSLALLAAQHSPLGALLVDLAGDVPAALGAPEPEGPGVAGWLAAGPEVPTDALARLEVEVGGGLRVLTRGHDPLDASRAEVLAAVLATDPRPVVVDCGTDPTGAALVIAAGATRSVLVTRACFLALRRATAAPLRPSEVVLVSEPGRSLTAADVEQCVGARVSATVTHDPAVARAVDAGLLGRRLPRALARELSRAA